MGIEILAIIPARAGSKGVPRKNLRVVGEKPLIAWTWDIARMAPSITRLIVSTDDHEVVELARASNVEVPFLRPATLADDLSLAVDVVEHTLSWLQQAESYRPDAVLLLQPTSPLRTAEDIEAAVALLMSKRAKSVVSVCSVEHHPLWTKCIDAEGQLYPWLTTKEMPQRRQELPEIFRLNGAIYLTRRDALLKHKSFHPPGTFGYVMPIERSLDIDTPWDLLLADLILTNRTQTSIH